MCVQHRRGAGVALGRLRELGRQHGLHRHAVALVVVHPARALGLCQLGHQPGARGQRHGGGVHQRRADGLAIVGVHPLLLIVRVAAHAHQDGPHRRDGPLGAVARQHDGRHAQLDLALDELSAPRHAVAKRGRLLGHIQPRLGWGDPLGVVAQRHCPVQHQRPATLAEGRLDGEVKYRVARPVLSRCHLHRHARIAALAGRRVGQNAPREG
mmetsp:Transcript_15226/g.47330  ORF Transcript_15226/g.47330 Transcript_15226/m.47330 type:complete len:211 (+) Transcript_15226:250-882(+)